MSKNTNIIFNSLILIRQLNPHWVVERLSTSTSIEVNIEIKITKLDYSLTLRAMSHEEIYGQPVPGNLREEKAFTFECSPIFLVDSKKMFENWPVCYQSGHVVCTAVGCLQKVASSDKALGALMFPTLIFTFKAVFFSRGKLKIYLLSPSRGIITWRRFVWF